MALYHDTIRSSPSFEPTLGSIPEVFEYEPLDKPATRTPSCRAQGQEKTEILSLDTASIAEPQLCKATSTSAIIQAPPSRVISTLAVAKVLRRVLEADLIRRRRIIRVYHEAIMLLKYLWRANERYGAVMLTSTMYMPR